MIFHDHTFTDGDDDDDVVVDSGAMDDEEFPSEDSYALFDSERA